jgi:hypothetical protein
MKNTFIISLLLILAIGCSTNSRKQEEIKNLHIKDSLKLVYQQDSIRKAKLEIEQQIIQDSIIKEEEKIAISNINFGINKYDYKTKEKIFLESLYNREHNDHQIGNFRFKMIPCFSNNNSLYRICLKGEKMYSYYLNVRDGYESLYSVLCAKYSEPDIHYGLPNWNESNHELVWEHQINDYIPCGFNAIRNLYYECDIWDIGNKRIEIRLYFDGKSEIYISNGERIYIPNSYKYDWKQVALVIYQKDILEKLKKEKMDNYEKELNEIIMKDKKELDKAINVL